MTRRSLFLTFLISAPAVGTSPADIEFYRKALEVEKHWDRFIRKLFGCKPEVPTTPENCRPQFGEIDYAAFTKWQRAALKLMGDPCGK